MSMRKISSQKKLIGNNPQQTLYAVEPAVMIESLYPSGSKREEIEKKFKNNNVYIYALRFPFCGNR
ncbi:MAG: hypothetical protein N2V75_08195 [Methanophagales archaeon]|nr:hypothetical protein [Methanophagales archaeon]